MEPKLQTYNECMDNIELFDTYVFHASKNGRFVRCYGSDGVFCFYWFRDYESHRLDGPAWINNDGNTEWCFFGEPAVNVSSQKEFDEWIVNKMKEV